MNRTLLSWVFLYIALLPVISDAAERLPGTAPLALSGNLELDALHYEQIQGYFLRRIALAREARKQSWLADLSAVGSREKTLAKRRAACRKMLGLERQETSIGEAEAVAIARDGYQIERITIPTKDGLCSRGILFYAHGPEQAGRRPAAIVCPDADTWPERFAGLDDPAGPPAWLAELLGRGAIVFIPQSVERLRDHPYCETANGKDRRAILYRLSYVVGRTMPGMDVRDAIAAVDYLARRGDVDPARIGLIGIGQGGMTALYTGAIDRRVHATVVAGYFQSRERCWAEPVDRRLPGQLLEFGDAEVAALMAPRFLGIVSNSDSPATRRAVEVELRRAAEYYNKLPGAAPLKHIEAPTAAELVSRAARLLAAQLGNGGKNDDATVDAAGQARRSSAGWKVQGLTEEYAQNIRDRHFEERLCYLRRLIDESEVKRQRRWGLLDCPADDFPKIKAAMLDEYRKLVGEVNTDGTPLRPRSELVLSAEKYKAYRIMLDVVEGVELYGILLVPNGRVERMPAVICQHGLTGTPEMVVGLGQREDTAYHEFGRRLAERGYVVFAPLILHRRPDPWINNQARQADAMGMKRLAMVVAKTRRAVDYLQTLPFVDPRRIGYYGLSYGGYSAIWAAPLEDRLAAVVVSGNFNDWRNKITSDAKPSYLRHPDEDMYDWDILHRFTHPELVLMTSPRPVCIEYGLRDGITTPEWTDRAWSQLAAIRDHVGLTDRIVMARFDGIHEVHGEESFEFLDRFLKNNKQAMGR